MDGDKQNTPAATDTEPTTSTEAGQGAPQAPTATAPAEPTQPEAGFFHADAPTEVAEQPGQSVSWTASEFIAHHKSPAWYAAVIATTAVFATIIYVLTKDKVASVVIVLVGLLFAGYAARKPQQVTYQLNAHTLNIGQRVHQLSDFRSYAITPEGAFSSIVLMPLKRFGLLTTIYYDPKDEDAILAILSQRLPHEERQPDAIDRAMRRIRF